MSGDQGEKEAAQATLVMIESQVNALPKAMRESIHRTADEIRATVAKAGNHGFLAFALVGARYQLEAATE